MGCVYEGCGCNSALKLIFSCSGAADTAEICDRSARQLTKRGVGKMYCLAGVGGRVPDILVNTKAATTILAIDGCDKDCARLCLKEAGFTEVKHLRVTDLGLKKGEAPATSERIELVVNKATEMLNA
jgi:uncharacterized metal-binding protein